MESLLQQQTKVIKRLEEEKEKEELLILEEMDRDWKLHQKEFDEGLKMILEKFLLRHFGKDYNSDLFSELYQVITNLLIYYKAEPRLF